MLSAALGFDRYAVLTPINGCPRCGGAVFACDVVGLYCLNCGWNEPTRAPGAGERPSKYNGGAGASRRAVRHG